ncbi:hypothetical protein AVEN_244565-1 [Araneus ventricosus]|uniref:Uncharacterized protein n=1 Tax=Araneus ventricosus TaxID=182803 RepID=A0A4Y2Q1A7_ARAVE|nr:hypothetical protein AVEN_244565-1 [Araneus ventricosus]
MLNIGNPPPTGDESFHQPAGFLIPVCRECYHINLSTRRNDKRSLPHSLISKRKHFSVTLDALSILYPSEKKNKLELQEESRDLFWSTEKVSKEGHFQVSLSWLDSNLPLKDNHHLAVKRLGAQHSQINSSSAIKHINI